MALGVVVILSPEKSMLKPVTTLPLSGIAADFVGGKVNCLLVPQLLTIIRADAAKVLSFLLVLAAIEILMSSAYAWIDVLDGRGYLRRASIDTSTKKDQGLTLEDTL